MVLDTLTCASRYETLHPLFAAAFDFLRTADWEKLPDGKIELSGDGRFFVSVQSYSTRSEAGVRYEAHQKYIDIQFLISGGERLEYLPSDCEFPTAVPYDEDGDIAFYEADGGTGAILREGSFAILFPGEFHRPSLSLKEPLKVRKAVVKVPVS